jgi:hypothetical protein
MGCEGLEGTRSSIETMAMIRDASEWKPRWLKR